LQEGVSYSGSCRRAVAQVCGHIVMYSLADHGAATLPSVGGWEDGRIRPLLFPLNPLSRLAEMGDHLPAVVFCGCSVGATTTAGQPTNQPESGALRAVHLSRHKWPGGLGN